MTVSARFWDRIATRYARTPVADEAAYWTKLDVTREHLRPGMDVLEFGCGTGTTALIHAPHVKQILAIDVSPNMLAIAESKAQAAGIANVSFVQSSIEDFGAPDGAFDTVLGMSILHLLPDKAAAIAKVHRLLKPGGVFVSSTACIGDMRGASLFRIVLPAGRALDLLPYVTVFGVRDLNQALRHAGFAIEHEWQPGKGKAVFIVARKAN